MDATNLYVYWVRGIRGVHGGLGYLINEKMTPGTQSIMELHEWIVRLKDTLKRMCELQGVEIPCHESSANISPMLIEEPKKELVKPD